MLNRDTIKYLAILAMLLNHIANLFLTPGTLLCEIFLDIGYFTAITMCYFLVEGFHFTHSKRKYGQRLLLFAILSQVPFMLAFHTPTGNMLLTLFFCLSVWNACPLLPSDAGLRSQVLSCCPASVTGPDLQLCSLFCLRRQARTGNGLGKSIFLAMFSLPLQIRSSISSSIPCFRLCCTVLSPALGSCAPAY